LVREEGSISAMHAEHDEHATTSPLHIKHFVVNGRGRSVEAKTALRKDVHTNALDVQIAKPSNRKIAKGQ